MTRAFVFSRGRTIVVALAVALAAALLTGVAWQVGGPRTGVTNAHAAVGGVTISMIVTGHRTGVFKGDDNSRTGLMTVIAYHYELTSPRDASSGLPTGQRLHHPVTITHTLGGSSPEFLNSLATNEVLTSVVITFNRVDKTGKQVNFYTVKLTNATISDVRQYTSGSSVLEDVSFTFQKIEQDDNIAKTVFLDDWESRV
jgi:type VI secretion system secreted protein Hcp